MSVAATSYLRVAKGPQHALMDQDELEWLAHWCVTDGNIDDHSFVEGWANDLTPDGFDLFVDAVMTDQAALLAE